MIKNKEDFIKHCVEIDKDTNEYKLNILGVIYIAYLTYGTLNNDTYCNKMIRKLLKNDRS